LPRRPATFSPKTPVLAITALLKCALSTAAVNISGFAGDLVTHDDDIRGIGPLRGPSST